MAFRKRDSAQILAEMLRSARGGDCKTSIFRAANLNHVRGCQYLESCVEAGLVAVDEGIYYLTDTGERLLEHWREVEARNPLVEGI